MNQFLQKNYEVLSTTMLFFGNLFLHNPTQELLQQIVSSDLLENWFIEVKNDSFLIENLVSEAQLEIKKEDAFKKIKSDYTELFIAKEPIIGAIPWGSVYLNKTNETFTIETEEVAKLYIKFGFEIPKDFKEPEDHIGLELLFLAYLLCSINNKNIENIFIDFLKNYVLTWVFSFINHLKNNANTKFYTLIAYLLNDFLIQLQHELDIKPIEKKLYF